MTFSTVHRRARYRVRQQPEIRGDTLALAYAEHSRLLLKLAALLVPDVGAAREVVYESFAALYREQQRREQQRREHGGLGCREEALEFLLRDVVCRARVVVTGAGLSPVVHDRAAGDTSVIRAVRALPAEQREALVLRYFGDLSDEHAAAAMGVGTSVLRINVARGMAELRAALGPQALARE
jgi:DNA-directed RNA polymerase specialized sigma24 family protein